MKDAWRWPGDDGGEETAGTRSSMERQIASALVDDLNNRHAHTVIGPDGREYNIRVAVALVSTDLPRCDGCGQERAGVREVTFQRVKDGQWYTAMWCADCRESADASMGPGGAWDGEQVYAMRVVGP